MGNGINGQVPKSWDPQDFINNWKNLCTSMLPFDSIMAFTLWQGGPPGLSNNSWFGNSTSIWNQGQPWGTASTWGTWDSFVPSTTATSTATAETTTQTQEEKDKAEFEKEQLGKKMDKLKKILNDYKSTLNRDVEADFLVIKEIERVVNNTSVTQENYDKLVEVFKENNIGEKLRTDVLNSMSPSKNSSFNKKINKECWTKENWSAQVRVTKDNVLEYMATFNKTSNRNFVGTLLNRIIINKDAEGKPSNDRAKIVEQLNDIQKSLIELAQDICNNSDISDESKKGLEKAIDTLKASSPDEALKKENWLSYQKKLANLFNLTRSASLEKFEKEHEFLGLTFSEEEKKKLEDSKM